MTVDQSGKEIVDAKLALWYEQVDQRIVEYLNSVIICLRELPTPQPSRMPDGFDMSRYAGITRAAATAAHDLHRTLEAWKASR
jgi:hypothetical protein